MQILAMVKKEIKVLFRNRLLIFSNIFLPILVIAVNLLYASTATVKITIGIWGDGNTEKEVEALMNSYNEVVEVSFIRYDNNEEALEEYHKKSTDCVIQENGDGSFDVYYNSEMQKSEVAYQYFVTALKDINSQNYSAETRDAILAAQKYTIHEVVSLSEEKTEELSGYIWTGFIWIFIYSNLSLAITQMQQERATKTLLYICKVRARWEQLFISKMVAGLLQFVLILTAFIVAVSRLNLVDYHFYWQQIPYWFMVFVSIFSIGHFLGTVIKNSALLVMIQMLMVFPLMLTNAIQTSQLDGYMKNTPVYCAMEVAKSAMLGQSPAMSNVWICIGTIALCYFITGLYLSKREPIKICKIQ